MAAASEVINQDIVSFESIQHFQEMFQMLNELRNAEKYCNVQLICGEQDFRVHEAILVACSDYFRQLIQPNQQRSTAINLDWINPDILETVIEFLYTAKVSISEQNIDELIAAADVFQINNLLRKCCEFVKQKVNVNNFEKYLKSVSDLKNKKMFLELFEQFFGENFNDILNNKRESLLTANYEYFKVFLSTERDLLGSECESLIFKTLVDWSRAELNSRSDYFPELFQFLDIKLLDYDIVEEQLKKEDWLNDFEKVLYALGVFKKRKMKKLPKKNEIKKYIIIIGGEDNNKEVTDKVFIYDIENKSLKPAANLNEAKKCSHSCVVNNQVFTVEERFFEYC